MLAESGEVIFSFWLVLVLPPMVKSALTST